MRRAFGAFSVALGALFACAPVAEQAKPPSAAEQAAPERLPWLREALGQVALPSLRAAAEAGEAGAQFKMGVLHLQGLLVERDEAEAARWLRAASIQRHAEAQYLLGALLLSGSGFERDAAEAAALWSLSAEAGFAQAQVGMGLLYLEGSGVEKDLERSSA